MIAQTKSLKNALKDLGVKAKCRTLKNKHGEWQRAESYFDCSRETFRKLCFHPLIHIVYAFQFPKSISVRVESGWNAIQCNFKINKDFEK